MAFSSSSSESYVADIDRRASQSSDSSAYSSDSGHQYPHLHYLLTPDEFFQAIDYRQFERNQDGVPIVPDEVLALWPVSKYGRYLFPADLDWPTNEDGVPLIPEVMLRPISVQDQMERVMAASRREAFETSSDASSSASSLEGALPSKGRHIPWWLIALLSGLLLGALGAVTTLILTLKLPVTSFIPAFIVGLALGAVLIGMVIHRCVQKPPAYEPPSYDDVVSNPPGPPGPPGPQAGNALISHHSQDSTRPLMFSHDGIQSTNAQSGDTVPLPQYQDLSDLPQDAAAVNVDLPPPYEARDGNSGNSRP